MLQEGNTKNGTTINDLAQMVARGFEETGAKFKKMDERFDAVDGRLDAIENRLQALESVIDLMRKDIAELHKESLQNELDMREMRIRIERIEKHLGLKL